MEAVTRPANARYLLDGEEAERIVEPSTNYAVARVKQDLRGGNTSMGVEVTSTVRSLGDSLARSLLTRHAEAGGFDLIHLWNHQRYSILASAVLTQVSGDTAAMRGVQETSAHYFQRPDRHVSRDGLFATRYDPNSTQLRGYGTYVRVGKDGGDWIGELAHSTRSPGYEINDLGIVSYADYRLAYGAIGHRWTRPTRYFRSLQTLISGEYQSNYDGDATVRTGVAFMSSELRNYWNILAAYVYRPMSYTDRATRGGAVVKGEGLQLFQFGLSTDNRKRLVAGTEFQWLPNVGEAGGELKASVNFTVKPKEHVLFAFNPNLNHVTGGSQYVLAISDSTATAFFGKRFLFAAINQTSLSLETRLNIAVSPAMTFELYAQPFFANGAYSNFKEYAQTRSARQLVYGVDTGTVTAVTDSSGAITQYSIDPDGAGPARPFSFANPDFNQLSLRGTAVFRWEYRPGSTIYLVWSHRRSGSWFRELWRLRFRARSVGAVQNSRD
jgi:hypothetical protein